MRKARGEEETEESEFFDAEIAPTDFAGFTAVDLEAEEAFEGGFFSFVGVVDSEFAVEPDFDLVGLADDADFVPVVPFYQFFALGGEGGFGFLVAFGGKEPAAACFVVKAGGPGAGFAVVVFALVAVDATVSAGFLEATEHHAGVAGEVVELHFESEVEVLVGFFGDEEGV